MFINSSASFVENQVEPPPTQICMVAANQSYIYQWFPSQQTSQMASILTFAPFTSAADNADPIPTDVQQLFSVVWQLQKDLCHEKVNNDALQQEGTTLRGIHAPPPLSMDLSDLDADHGYSGYSDAYGDVKIILYPKLTKVSPEADDAYYSLENRCQADHDAKVTYCFKQTIQGMGTSPFIKEILTSPLPLKYTLDMLNKNAGTSDPIKHMRDFYHVM